MKLSKSQLVKGDLEKAWTAAERGSKLARQREWVDTIIEFELLKSTIQDQKGNNLESVKLNLSSLDLIKRYNVAPKLRAKTLIQLSNSYKYLQEFDRSLFYLKKAERIIETEDSCKDLQGELLINFGSVYLKNNQLDSAELYLTRKVNEISIDFKENDRFKASLNYWLSRLYEERKEFDKAIKHLKITTSIDSLQDKQGQFNQDRFQLAVIFQGKAEFNTATQIYTECLDYAAKNGYLRTVHSCLKGLYDCHIESGDSLKALRYLIQKNTAESSLFEINKLDEIRRLEISHQIELVGLKKKHELQELTLEKEKSTLITWITITTSILVIGAMVFLALFFRKRLRSHLMLKKKEIAIYATEISSKNQAINNAIESLNMQTSEMDGNSELKSTLNELKFEIKNEDFWKDFEVRFRDVQTNFYRSLLQKHSDLTKNEVRLCSFIKLQLTTKEIAALTKKSIGSINVAKHRLKKKLNLPKNQTLYYYINSELFL